MHCPGAMNGISGKNAFILSLPCMDNIKSETLCNFEIKQSIPQQAKYAGRPIGPLRFFYRFVPQNLSIDELSRF
jgi:hypothetical protein